jgi:hypothetical protein
LGWQISSFVYIYQTSDSAEVSDRLLNWYHYEPYLIAIGAIITVMMLILRKFSQVNPIHNVRGLKKQLVLQHSFLLLLCFNYLTMLMEIHLQVFELMSLIVAIWSLNRWGSIFYRSDIETWRHPTTYGSFFVSGLLVGFSLLSMLQLEGIEVIQIKTILVVLLAFDLLIVFARFQFLSKAGERSHHFAQKLMGRYLLYFGSRVIVGIFMPGIFILYMKWISGNEIQGVEVLILIGTFIDRYLFLISAESN